MVLESVPTGNFDLYYVLVTLLFGSIGVSIVAMAGVIFLMMMLSRVQLYTALAWTGTYLFIMGCYYLGSLGFALGFFIMSVYVVIAITRATYRTG